MDSLPQRPRHYQIAVLLSLLFYGVGWLQFGVAINQIVILLIAALLTRYICTKLAQLPAFDARCPLISGLSLCLLLPTNSILVLIVSAILTIASKVRYQVEAQTYL